MRPAFDWIEAWYNRDRRHSRLDYRSPEQYERDHERRLSPQEEKLFKKEELQAA